MIPHINSNFSRSIRSHSPRTTSHSQINHLRNTSNTHTRRRYAKKSCLEGDKILFITGSTGELGPGLLKRSLQRGYKVIACSRNPRFTSPNSDMLEFHKTTEEELIDKDYWASLIDSKVKKGKANPKLVSVINLIGAAVPPPGKTLEDINVKPPLAIHKGLQQYAENNQDVKSTFVHISSICATVLGDKHPYSAMRKSVDEQVTVKTDHVFSTVLRPGLVFNNMREGNMINMGHAYSPEQFATFPVHFVIGSGEQIQQPVWQDDLSDAIINATNATEDSIVDAVGPESMTQSEMFEFFVKLRGGVYRKVRIPYEFGHVIANYFPKGRIAPYSIAAFEALDRDEHKKPLPTEPFENLVGHRLSSMSDIYYIRSDEPIILSRPPVIEHIKEIFGTLLTNEDARREVFNATKKYGPQISCDIVSQFARIQ